MTTIELLKFMLPDFLIDHFEVVSTTNTEVLLYFEEKKLNLQKNLIHLNLCQKVFSMR
jgi:hypothetical protein